MQAEVVAAGKTDTEIAPVAAPRPRRILVFIDNHSLDTGRRSEVLQSLENFLNRTKRAEDQVAIVAWNRSAKMVTPFTTSNEQLQQGIASLRQSVRSGISFPQELERVRSLCQREYDQAESGFGRSYQEAFQSCAGSIQAFAEEAAYSNKLLLDGLRSTVAQFAGLDGKKALVFAGAHLPIAPGEELAIWTYRLFQPKLRSLS